jgi:hypothetical protein
MKTNETKVKKVSAATGTIVPTKMVGIELPDLAHAALVQLETGAVQQVTGPIGAPIKPELDKMFGAGKWKAVVPVVQT